MKKKLNKETRLALIKAKKVITEHSKEQESEYKLILKQLKIKDGSDLSFAINDYLYNGYPLSLLEEKLNPIL
jgi:hypothetical protein